MPITLRTRVPIVATICAMTLFIALGCNSSKPPIVAASASPNAAPTTPAATDVGPIPGAQAEPIGIKNPYAGNAIAIADGRRLFNWYNCSGCHGGHGGGGMGPSLRDQKWLYGNRDDQVFASIAQGRSKGMPSWGSKIPQSQIWELVAYIKSMRTPEEADPPNEPANEKVGAPTPQEPSGVPVTQ